MAKIKKYRLKSQRDEEEEFEVTKITKTIRTTELTQKVDGEGNIISARHGTKSKNTIETQEGIVAVSLPSRTPAIVEILETEGEDAIITEAETYSERPKEVKIDTNPGGRQSAVDINKSLYPEEGVGSPVSVPKAGEVNWV